MKTLRLKRVNILAIVIVHVVLFLFTGFYVFVANDESQSILAIFKLSYLLPVAIYAGGVTGVSIVIFLFLNRFISIIFSLSISVMLALPVGLLLVSAFFELISRI